jgi:dUTP pyrophosphatase
MSIDLTTLIDCSAINISNTTYNHSIHFKKLDKNAIAPSKANHTDAGYDLYALEDCIIPSQNRLMIKTGISMAIPDGYVGLIWPRSGLAVKHGLDTMAGVVDSGYRGEVCVVLQNHGYEPYNVKAGDRIAQILFQSILSVQMIETEELNNSDRGQSGFGSSGN